MSVGIFCLCSSFFPAPSGFAVVFVLSSLWPCAHGVLARPNCLEARSFSLFMVLGCILSRTGLSPPVTPFSHSISPSLCPHYGVLSAKCSGGALFLALTPSCCPCQSWFGLPGWHVLDRAECRAQLPTGLPSNCHGGHNAFGDHWGEKTVRV